MTISLFNGLSGLSSHQKMLDVVSNNIANLNSNGFKRGSLRMAESQSQTMSQATTPTDTLGGTNPLQVGHGVKSNSVAYDFNQGSMEYTGRTLDMAIQGEGFFVLEDGAGVSNFTRVGSFAADSNNYLVDQATGYRVQSANGPIVIPKDESLPPQASSQVSLRGNFSPATPFPGGTPVTTGIKVYDIRGEMHDLEFSLVRTGAQTWDMTTSLPNGDGVVSDNLVSGITFNEDGSFAGVTGAGAGDNNISVTFNGLTTAQNITFSMGTIGGLDGLTQLGGESSAAAVEENGYASGSMVSLAVDPDGMLTGRYSNGERRDLAQIQVATFSNPEGLEKASNNMYLESANSGQPALGKGLSGRAGSVLGSNLESSNVDVSKEVALMIVAQRGFQMNARVITVANDLLQEISGLVR